MITGIKACFLVAMLSVTCAAQSPVSYKELPNFHKVNQHLYRGGQPRAGGIKKLGELGIRTIINLRGDDEGEVREAEVAGIRYFNISMPAWGRPTLEQVAQALAIINTPEYWPVFVHCKKGSDRTGTVLACYRISRDGWSVEQAQAEARRYGMQWFQLWMKDFISDYAHHHEREGDSVELKNHIGAGVRITEAAARKSHVAIGRAVKNFFR